MMERPSSPWRGSAAPDKDGREETDGAGTSGRAMKIFYGWVIVAAGIVATCIGQGAMLSLSVFLQPMSEAMGWSRTGISTAAFLSWIAMGVGSLFWEAPSTRP